MSDWASFKPLLSTLVLPPVPFLGLILLAAVWGRTRRLVGSTLLSLGVLGLWLASCQGTAIWLQDHVLRPPAPLVGAPLARLQALGHRVARGAAHAPGRGGVPPPAAILVLGAGREALAPELGMADLSVRSLARLNHGVWLSKQTGLPLGFSGGVGWREWSLDPTASEADVAARVAEQQFGVHLRWVENASFDTRGNAALGIAMLASEGVPEVVLVTSAAHMPRAVRAFEQAARAQASQQPGQAPIRITPAATGYWRHTARPLLDWMPSGLGMADVNMALHEWLGLLTGF